MERSKPIFRVIQYYHHGIYIGNNDVVDFGKNISNKNSKIEFKSKVRQISISKFKKEKNERIFLVVHTSSQRHANDVVDHAIQRVREGKQGVVLQYNLFTNNCEHFACEMKIGERTSFQIEVFEFIIWPMTSQVTYKEKQ